MRPRVRHGPFAQATCQPFGEQQDRKSNLHGHACPYTEAGKSIRRKGQQKDCFHVEDEKDDRVQVISQRNCTQASPRDAQATLVDGVHLTALTAWLARNEPRPRRQASRGARARAKPRTASCQWAVWIRKPCFDRKIACLLILQYPCKTSSSPQFAHLQIRLAFDTSCVLYSPFASPYVSGLGCITSSTSCFLGCRKQVSIGGRIANFSI